MNVSGLQNFLSQSFITILATGSIGLILKNWKEQAYLKIGGVLLIALVLNDLATRNGNGIFSFLRWIVGLFGVQL